MTRLFLIRHGETDYSLENRYCGFNDPPLNDRGIWQSKKLGERLKNLRIDRVYSSDLKRGYQAAEIIFEDSQITKSADFREMNFGIFEGLSHKEIAKVYPRLYRDWISNPSKIKVPEGEGLMDLRKRVKDKLSFILYENKDKTIALVTHGGPIKVILCDALKIGFEGFWRMEQELGALNIIDYSKELPPVVVKMNDISHLSMQKEAIL